MVGILDGLPQTLQSLLQPYQSLYVWCANERSLTHSPVPSLWSAYNFLENIQDIKQRKQYFR